MTAGLLGMAARASLSAGVMILVVVLLRRQFQSRTPRRVFCLLWDMVLARQRPAAAGAGAAERGRGRGAAGFIG